MIYHDHVLEPGTLVELDYVMNGFLHEELGVVVDHFFDRSDLASLTPIYNVFFFRHPHPRMDEDIFNGTYAFEGARLRRVETPPMLRISVEEG